MTVSGRSRCLTRLACCRSPDTRKVLAVRTTRPFLAVLEVAQDLPQG